MALQITIDLDASDLQFFTDAAKRAKEKAGHLSAEQITSAASKLLASSIGVKTPAFITQRLTKLQAMIDMVNDVSWGLADADKQRVLSALTYFAEPNDVIPDELPVFGLLDDAIMIELCQRELQAEIDAYEDFVAHRALEAKRRDVDPATLKIQRAEWLEDMRAILHARMAQRRRSFYVPTNFSQALFRIGG